MKVAAFIIDFRTQAQAEKLSVMLRDTSSIPSTDTLDIYHVDNASPVPVALSEEQKSRGIVLIRNKENRGYAGGFEDALSEVSTVRYDYYLLLNSDLELHEDIVGRLLKRIHKDDRLAVVGARIVSPDGKGGVKSWGGRGVVSPLLGLTRMVPCESDATFPKWSYVPGAVMMIRRLALEELGGFDTRYRMYFEETDLCIRLQRNNWELAIANDAVAYHAVNSLQHGVPSRSFSYFFIRNNLAFWDWNFSRLRLVQYVTLAFVLVKEVVRPCVFRLRRTGGEGAALKFALKGFIDAYLFDGRPTAFELKNFPK
jgi:GT2 family glycosyltransferase